MGLFLLPLVYSPFTYDGYVLPKLLLARLLVVSLLLLWIARAAATRALDIKRTPLDIPLVAFIASAFLSSIFAENQNVAVLGTYSRYDGLLTVVTYAAVFWLSVQTLSDQVEARVLIRWLLASGYVVASVAIIQSIHDSIDQPSIAPAFGSLGNPNVLGGYLALVIAVSGGELLRARSLGARIVLLNVMVVVGVALLLSFSRSAWLAAVIGMAVVSLGWRRHLGRLAILVPVVLVVLLALALQHALLARALTMFNPAVFAGSRLGIWKDSLSLIASRPLIGYGPDNVGLVFPRFQTGDWGLAAGHIRQPIDKAHLELLQVAATQGVIGVAAYLFILFAFIRTFWRARKIDHVASIAAGWIAYQVSVQLNFTALASALPFWIFAAAAVATCGAIRTGAVAIDQRRAYTALGAVVAAGAAVVAWGVATPYLADLRLREAVDADYSGHPHSAQPLAAEARRLNPRESVYAVETGNTAFELGQWAAARAGYQEAARLGTFNPLVYRNLALADRNLGLTAEAREAARKAVQLDPRDPANQALLAEFETNP